MIDGMDAQEAREVLAEALVPFERLSHAELARRAPRLKRSRRFLWVTLSETYEPVEGSYESHTKVGVSGTRYNVTAEVFWSDYATQVIRVMVCVDDGGESAGRPLCESIEVPPARMSS